MITFSHVTKQFSRVRAVDDLSFSVEKGEIVAFLGPNGAGKTTSLRMILQLIQPDKGYIHYAESLQTSGKLEKSKIGYLPEERGIYQETPILKTLIYLASLRGMPKDQAHTSAVDWLVRFGLKDRANDKVSSLSKGNQQKIQFIASVIHKPDFAILDEPFSGFDPINQEIISNLIRTLRDEGTTILFSAHQMQLVERIADRIILLSGGKELMSGTMQDLRKHMGDGQKLEVSFSGDVLSEQLYTSEILIAEQDSVTGMWQITPRPGIALNEALHVLTSAGNIETLRTTEVNLHDIFIQSFGVKQGEENEA